MTGIEPTDMEFIMCAAAPAALIFAAFMLLLYAFGGLVWDIG